MENMIYLNGHKLIHCTAIALEAGDTERQNAIYAVQEFAPGDERFEFVIFGYGMPKNEDDFAEILDDYYSMATDSDTLDTVILAEGYSRADYY